MFGRRARREVAQVSLLVGGARVDGLVKRSTARRGLSLRLNAEGRIQVNAPMMMPMSAIEAFVSHHAAWLSARLAERVAVDWSEGACLPYLGGELVLGLDTGMEGDAILLPDNRLVCAVLDTETHIRAWYWRRAAEVLAARLDEQCARLGQTKPAWRLSDARTRWGSLSAKGVVGLNWRLVKASLAEIDYVICHELAHRRHADHSPAYWREVERLYPDYRVARARLRQRGALYLVF